MKQLYNHARSPILQKISRMNQRFLEKRFFLLSTTLSCTELLPEPIIQFSFYLDVHKNVLLSRLDIVIRKKLQTQKKWGLN